MTKESRFLAHILDAAKFPEDWFEHTSSCGRMCESCDYCSKTAKDMLVGKIDLDEMFCSKAYH